MEQLKNKHTKVNRQQFDVLMSLLEKKTGYTWCPELPTQWSPFVEFADEIEEYVYIFFALFRDMNLTWEVECHENDNNFVEIAEVLEILERCTDKAESASTEREDNKVPYEILEQALIDVLDGNSQWYEIQEHTGLSDERCQEIQRIFNKITLNRVY